MPAPDPDVIEISLFSRGSGEAIAVHVGDGKWLLIDSLLGAGGLPITLDYLRSNGVALDNVEAILLTHWHDDHIEGAASLVESCVNAVVAIPATLQSDEFIGFLEHTEPFDAERFGSGVSELQQVMTTVISRGRSPRWSSAEKRISGEPTGLYQFEALSPSDKEVTAFIKSVDKWLKIQAIGGRLVKPLRNDSSVASVISIGEDNLLLFGADLEAGRPTGGWEELCRNAWKNRGKADFLKIPHHGSKNAHYDGVWSDLVLENVFAALTPWNKNKGLPTLQDVKRILKLTKNAFAVSQPKSRVKLRRMRSVENVLRDIKIEIVQDSNDVGHVRFRRPRATQMTWDVELFGIGCSHLETLAA